MNIAKSYCTNHIISYLQKKKKCQAHHTTNNNKSDLSPPLDDESHQDLEMQQPKKTMLSLRSSSTMRLYGIDYGGVEVVV